MKQYPQEHRKQYQIEWDKTVNRLEREFLFNFSTPEGDIVWEKLVQFNSGKERYPLRKSPVAPEL